MNWDVVVSGVGLVCSLGTRPDVVWRRIAQGRRSVPTRRKDLPEDLPPGALVPRFMPRRHLDRRRSRYVTREVILGLLAARRAIHAAGHSSALPAQTTACLVAAPLNLGHPDDLGEALSESVTAGGRFDTRRFGSLAPDLISPIALVRALSNSLLCSLTIEFQLTGLNANLASGGNASLLALDCGLRAIRSGRARRALVVAHDGVLTGICRLRGSSRTPGSSRRSDMLAGPDSLPAEAAVALLLERAADARVQPFASLYGFGCSRERASPRSGFANEALHAALRDAGCDPANVQVVHADNLGGPNGSDVAASLRAAGVPTHAFVFSSARAVGYAPAAAGALGTVLARHALAAQTGRRHWRRAGAPLPLAAVMTRDPTGEHAALIIAPCNNPRMHRT